MRNISYWEYATLKIHDNWEAFLAAEHPNPERMFAMTTKGSTVFSQLKFIPGDWFIFGAEGSGLPDDIRSAFSAQNRIRLPMRPDNRSLMGMHIPSNLDRRVSCVCLRVKIPTVG